MLCLFLSSSLFAQLSIQEEVVVTGHAAPVPFENLARSIRVISRQEIEELPVQSISDLLRYASGVEVRSRGPFGSQTDLSIRGSTFEQVLIMVDGIPMNSSQTGHHNGDFPLSLQDVERVEILLGSGSSIHGANALGGAVNLVTRTNAGGPIEMQASVGQFGLVSASARMPLARRQPLQSVSAWIERSSGFRFNRDFKNAGVRIHGAPNDRLRFQVAHLSRDFGADQFYGPSPSRESTDQTLLSLKSSLLQEESWKLDAQAAYRSHGDRFVWDLRRPNLVRNDHREHSIDGKAVLTWRAAEARRITLGVAAGQDWLRSSNLGTRQIEQQSIFFEGEQKLGERIRVFPGFRYDRYGAIGDAWSPSLSGLFWLSSSWKLHAYTGKSFRVPTFTERFYHDPNHAANPFLEPERAFETELGLKWVPGSNFSAALNLFRRVEKNAIDWVRSDPSRRWRTANFRELITSGAEGMFEYRSGSGTRIGANYTYLNPELRDRPLLSKYSLRLARHGISGSLVQPLPDRWNLGLHLSYRDHLDARNYSVADLRLSRDFGERNQVFLEISNLLNTKYEEIPGVVMPPAWVRLGLKLNLGRSDEP